MLFMVNQFIDVAKNVRDVKLLFVAIFEQFSGFEPLRVPLPNLVHARLVVELVETHLSARVNR